MHLQVRGRRRFPAWKGWTAITLFAVHTIRGDADGKRPAGALLPPGDKRIAQDLAELAADNQAFYWQIMAQWFAVKACKKPPTNGRAGGNGKADFYSR